MSFLIWVNMQKRADGKIYADMHKSDDRIHFTKPDAQAAIDFYPELAQHRHPVAIVCEVAAAGDDPDWNPGPETLPAFLAPKPLNALQGEVLGLYEQGEFIHLTSIEESKSCGDLLVPFVLAEASDAGVGSDAREALTRMLRSAARQLEEVASQLEALDSTEAAAAAAADGGPMVKLRFQPQAWQNDYAIEADAEGEVRWSIPLSDPVFDDARTRGGLPEDDRYESDALREHLLAPKWMRDWSGPFYVRIENRDEIEAHFEGLAPSSVATAVSA